MFVTGPGGQGFALWDAGPLSQQPRVHLPLSQGQLTAELRGGGPRAVLTGLLGASGCSAQLDGAPPLAPTLVSPNTEKGI